MMPIGLTDKLYWRRIPGTEYWYHCFKRKAGGGYVSLCGRYEIERSGGQSCSRPAVHFRCGRCDMLEIQRRGWEESGPASGEKR